jgi:hypothetical protein
VGFEGGPLTQQPAADPELHVSVPLRAVLDLLKAVVIKMPDIVRQEIAKDLASRAPSDRNKPADED